MAVPDSRFHPPTAGRRVETVKMFIHVSVKKGATIMVAPFVCPNVSGRC